MLEALEFEKLRELMVTRQLVARGIKDEDVLGVMRKVPRHLFVEEGLMQKAYDDMALPAGKGQTISQPYMVAAMTELLELKGVEKTLEIGTGTGYQSAVLSGLAGGVYTIERFRELSEKAKETLTGLGCDNIRFRVGDGTLGWPEEAPFQRILVTAAAPDIPRPLIEQLDEGGIIVAPVGDLFSQQLQKGKKHGKKLIRELHTTCVFVPLVGEFGWSE